jgi:uncharacterized membrane protein
MTSVINEERLEALERRAESFERRMLRLEAHVLDGMALREPARPAAAATASPPAPPALQPHVRPDRPAREIDLEQLVGGRLLAWVGGLAVLAGLALLFALAVSRGWIGEGARAAIGGALSAGLVVLGLRLHDRRRTEAARAAVGTGIAGLFMTVTVAAHVYGLIPATAGLALALAVGALAADVAVRWSSPTIAALGIAGAVLAPLLVGAPSDAITIAFVFVASASAAAVALHRRWDWLALASFVLGAPQWLWWLFDHARLASALATLVGFGALYLAAALIGELRLPAKALRTSAAFMIGLNALVLGLAGYAAIDHLASRPAAIAWLAGLAAVHAVAGALVERSPRISHELGLLLLTLAVLLANAAFALATDGPFRAIGWAASAVGFAALARRRREGADRHLTELGLGGHVAAAAVQACAQIDITQLAAPGAETGAVAALGALAAGCLVSARLAAADRERWRIALDAGGLLALAGVAALTLQGPALTAAWAFEALALGRIARRTDDDVAGAAALAHLGAAALYALATFAQPIDLIDGGAPLGSAALGLAAIAAAAFAGAWLGTNTTAVRTALAGAGAATLLYLASLAVVEWAPGASTDALLQQGQLQLSALWAVAGVVALVIGLRLDQRAIRLAALGLLATTAGKVFLYDLAALTSVYRVASFIGLGLLLLLAAFAYQRLRPEPLQDLRAMPKSLR